MDFISGLYTLYLKDRVSEIHDNGQHASDIQSEQLSNLLLEASETEWGKRFDFKTIFSYQEFRERLPVQRNTDLLPYLTQMQKGESNILWPGVPKDFLIYEKGTQVPIFVQSVEEIFLKGIGDSYALFVQNHPNSKLLEGYSANVGNGDDHPYMNELYALIRENEPFLSSLLNLPKRVGTDKDGNPSVEWVLQETIGQKVTSFRGTPKRLNVLLKGATRKTGKSNLKELWPEAEVLFDRGPAALTSKRQEEAILLTSELEIQASYMSPEGFFGIQDISNDPSYLLLLDLSTFYEFIPAGKDDSHIIPLEDVALNTDYQLVISNCNGLWRCCSEGPLLRFVSVEPYRFILL
jgi:hypothetical protein